MRVESIFVRNFNLDNSISVSGALLIFMHPCGIHYSGPFLFIGIRITFVYTHALQLCESRLERGVCIPRAERSCGVDVRTKIKVKPVARGAYNESASSTESITVWIRIEVPQLFYDDCLLLLFLSQLNIFFIEIAIGDERATDSDIINCQCIWRAHRLHGKCFKHFAVKYVIEGKPQWRN